MANKNPNSIYGKSLWSILWPQINSKEDAKKTLNDSFKGFIFLAALYIILSFYVKDFLFTGISLIVWAFILKFKKSRIAASILLILSSISLVLTILAKLGFTEGGKNVFLAIIIWITSINAFRASFIYHNPKSFNKKPIALKNNKPSFFGKPKITSFTEKIDREDAKGWVNLFLIFIFIISASLLIRGFPLIYTVIIFFAISIIIILYYLIFAYLHNKYFIKFGKNKILYTLIFLLYSLIYGAIFFGLGIFVFITFFYHPGTMDLVEPTNNNSINLEAIKAEGYSPTFKPIFGRLEPGEYYYHPFVKPELREKMFNAVINANTPIEVFVIPGEPEIDNLLNDRNMNTYRNCEFYGYKGQFRCSNVGSGGILVYHPDVYKNNITTNYRILFVENFLE